MSNSGMLAFLLMAGSLTPATAMGQRAMELAMAGPQPHFVAAWAPKKEREAERSAVLAGRVSLELRDVPLDAALKALANQAGLLITYSSAALPAEKRVTISARDVAVVTALTEILFRSGLDVVVDRDGALALVVCRHPVAETTMPVDSGEIAGTVTDKATGSSLAGATVVVEGTRLSATTNTQGQYVIHEVPSGAHSVRARYIGYLAEARSVTVGAAQTVNVDFALVRSVHKLDELVTVTPGGIQTQLRAVPSPITVITAEDIEVQRPQSFTDVFRQTVPGAVGFDRPSTPVSTFLSMRGATEVAAGGTTKVLVDGIEASRFSINPVDPSSIDRIEVLRGPQAATVYGPDAAAGVIQIFTKRGDPSRVRPEVSLRAQTGLLQTPYEGFKAVVRTDVGAEVRGGTGDATYSLGARWWRLPNWVAEGGAASNQSVPSVYAGLNYGRGVVNLDLAGRYHVTNNHVNLNPLVLQTGAISRPAHTAQEFTNQTVGARLGVSPTGSWRSQLSLGVDRLTLRAFRRAVGWRHRRTPCSACRVTPRASSLLRTTLHSDGPRVRVL